MSSNACKSTKVQEPIIDQLYVNITTGEYIENFTNSQLKSILKKQTKETTKFKADIGESHWKRSDKIVIPPIHCKEYVRKVYTKLYLN